MRALGRVLDRLVLAALVVLAVLWVAPVLWIIGLSLRPNEQLAWSSLSMYYVRAGLIKEAESASGKARILGWGGKVKKD